MLAALLCAAPSFAAPAPRRPNIVFLMTDDQRSDTIAHMPTVRDRLAGEGVTFTNAFVPTPLCSPGRASALTGLYAHRHGVVTLTPPNGGAAGFIGADRSTIATWLQAAGYRTGFFGKYMNSYWGLGPPDSPSWYIPPGWNVWAAMAYEHFYDYTLVQRRGTVAYDTMPADYSTDVLAGRVLQFIRRSVASGRPFFVHFTPYAPHGEVPALVSVPAPRHVGMFADLPRFRPPNFNEPDVNDKPSWIRERAPLTPLLEAVADVHRQKQLEALQAVDDAVARILRLLRKLGQDRNTIFVFTSDNGFTWAEHRLFLSKHCAYEECGHVPLVIRYPAGVAGGREESRLALTIDIAPTLAELARITPPAPVDGRSLVPLLAGSAAPWRQDVLLEGFDLGGAPRYHALRTMTWKYIENHDSSESELYDLVRDPYELDNRAGEFAYRVTITALQERLRALEVAATGPPPTR